MTFAALQSGGSSNTAPDSFMIETQKIRIDRFFDNLMNTHMKQSKAAQQPMDNVVMQNIKKIYDIHTGELKLTTTKNEDGSITTKEYCRVPHPYIQSETTQFEDGSKIIINYFPIGNKPAKKTEISSDGCKTTTTTYDSNGREKNITCTLKDEEGAGVEESIDKRYARATIRKFDKNGITQQLASFVDGKISFKLDCDETGDLKHESNFYTFLPEDDVRLQKEVIYNRDGSYIRKEYNVSGRIYSTEMILPAKKKGIFE